MGRYKVLKMDTLTHTDTDDYERAIFYGSVLKYPVKYTIWLYDNLKEKRIKKVIRRGLFKTANEKLEDFNWKYGLNIKPEKVEEIPVNVYYKGRKM